MKFQLLSAKSTRSFALVIIRITTGANAWRKVEGDRRICKHKRKGNVLSSCVIPLYVDALATMALTEKHQKKVQVCEKQPDKKN